MDGGGDAPESGGHGPQVVPDGEFAGWLTWRGSDPFEDQSGPYYFREEPDGSVLCAFRAERKHMNPGGRMHGGCLMTFADMALFALCREELEGARGVTVALDNQFLDAGREGDFIEAAGEVTRAGSSLIFARGQIFCGARTLLTFSGIIKKLRPKA